MSGEKDEGTIMKLIILAAMLFLMILTLIMYPPEANAQSRIPKRDVPQTFEQWRKKQPKRRIQAVKAARSQSKRVNGERSKNDRILRREERIREGIIKTT